VRSRAFCALVGLAACVAACDRSASAGAGASAAGADAAVDDAGRPVATDAGDARAPFAVVDAGGADDTAIPPTASEELTTRAKHLLEAIAAGNPDLAVDIVFPRDGYIAARDTTDAAKLWDKKVSAIFKKQVGHLHKKKGIDRAQFVSIELGHSVTQIAPHRHDWKKPVWRVKGSHLAYMIDGKPFKVPIAEMVAYKGAWYVTRLR